MLYLIDMAIVACSYGVPWAMEMINGKGAMNIYSMLMNIAVTIAIYTVFMGMFRVNAVIWRYAGDGDYLHIFTVSGVSGVVASLVFEVLSKGKFSLLFSALGVILSTAVLTLSRIMYRELIVRKTKKSVSAGKRLLIVGAGSAASIMLDEIKNNPACGLTPVALVDDDESKIGRYINGIKVWGKISDAGTVCEHTKAELIYIAIPSASNEERSVILEKCVKTKIPVKILPYIAEINGEKDMVSRVRDIDPEELLGRETIKLADEKILSFVKDRTVLITGGGGSIGAGGTGAGFTTGIGAGAGLAGFFAGAGAAGLAAGLGVGFFIS